MVPDFTFDPGIGNPSIFATGYGLQEAHGSVRAIRRKFKTDPRSADSNGGSPL